MFKTDEDRTAETARLNDLARTDPHRVNATWYATKGVADLIEGGQDRRRELQEAIASFSAFHLGDEGYRERDFGALTLWGQRLCWKIDYFAPEGEELSAAEWSVELTRRVLTVLLVHEY
ncbi:DUF3768 domain-containing protein [Phenylobacterium sp. LjRoot225]|uniref:DUF3768 domain-containing protein n=1 Tax=Phenylobacterium sp. LjRoot225 TaxID=3342285 RepID=UPI003ECCBA4C